MKKQILLPKHSALLEQMGEKIKLARKRRRLTAIQVAERAGIARSTLYLVEKGDVAWQWVLILMYCVYWACKTIF